MPATATPPAGLGASGRALWDALTADLDFEEHELALLVETCRVRDRLDRLAEVVDAEGVTVSTPQGVKAHPALVEARAQELVLSRLVASLRLPDAEGTAPQRRGASRGAYGPRLAKPGPRVARGGTLA